MTFPVSYNLGPAKTALATGARVCVSADSLGSIPSDAGGMTNQIMKGFPLTEITAYLSEVNQEVTRYTKDGSPNEFLGGSQSGGYIFQGDAQYFGMALSQSLEYDFTTDYTPGTLGRIGRLELDTTNIFGSVNGFSLVTSAISTWAVRYLFLGLTANAHTVGIEARDDGYLGTLLATWDQQSTARKYHHKSEGDPDSAARSSEMTSEVNAFYPDVELNAGDDVLMLYEAAVHGTTDHITAGGYLDCLGCLFYETNGSGAWTGASGGETYITPMSANSWTAAGHGGNTESSVSEPKSYDDDNLTHFLDVTTLSLTQEIVVIVMLDAEGSNAATTKAYFVDLMAKWDASCAAIGLPQPKFIFIHHWYDNTKTQATNEDWGQGMYDAALTNSRCGFYSIYQAQDGLVPDASGAGDFRTWCTTNGFDSYDYGTLSSQDVSAIDWSTDGTHPAGETSAAAFAKLVADAISAGTYDANDITTGGVRSGWKRYHGYARKGQRF